MFNRQNSDHDGPSFHLHDAKILKFSTQYLPLKKVGILAEVENKWQQTATARELWGFTLGFSTSHRGTVAPQEPEEAAGGTKPSDICSTVEPPATATVLPKAIIIQSDLFKVIYTEQSIYTSVLYWCT